MGEKVIAIDFKKEELLETADGPLKIIMDARELKFLDESFQTVTAFFSFYGFQWKVRPEKSIPGNCQGSKTWREIPSLGC